MNNNYELERTTIEGLRTELKSLYDGKEYGRGYFKTTFNDVKENELIISIFEVLDNLDVYEVNEMEIYDYEKDEYTTVDIAEYWDKGTDDGTIIEINADNTYNWNSPISHHINFEIYRDMNYDDYLVRFRVHCGYTDVRVGYSDWIYLKFNYEEEFLESLMECGKYIEVKMDGKNYCLSIDVLSDEIRVEEYDEENGYDDIWDNDTKNEILDKMYELNLIIY